MGKQKPKEEEGLVLPRYFKAAQLKGKTESDGQAGALESNREDPSRVDD